MHTGRGILMVILAALVGACHQPAGAGPPAAPRFQVLDVDAAATGQAILEAINNERAAYGLGGLSYSSDLSTVAQEHADDMVNRHYFNHTTPDGQGPTQRLRAAGVDFAACGETSHYPDVRPQSAINDWLQHPGGRSQMLDGRFSMAGVGIAYSQDEQRYYVNVMYLQPYGYGTGSSWSQGGSYADW